MRVASENRVPVAARAALTRAVTATDAQLSRTRTLERGEVVQTHALFRRIRRDGHRRRARRDGRPTRRDARAGHRRRSLEGHLRRARIHARTRARQSSRTSQNDHTHHETPFPPPRSSPPPSRGRPASPARDRRRETLGHHPSRVRGPSRRPGHARDRRARPRPRETSRNIFYARVVEIARTHRVRRERHHRRIRRIDNDVPSRDDGATTFRLGCIARKGRVVLRMGNTRLQYALRVQYWFFYHIHSSNHSVFRSILKPYIVDRHRRLRAVVALEIRSRPSARGPHSRARARARPRARDRTRVVVVPRRVSSRLVAPRASRRRESSLDRIHRSIEFIRASSCACTLSARTAPR